VQSINYSDSAIGNDILSVQYQIGGCRNWAQAAIPTTAVPTKSEHWCQNEINIAGQGELEAQRAS